nr:MAG TPA: hypothetical protein [Caudoviricetes sp.]
MLGGSLGFPLYSAIYTLPPDRRFCRSFRFSNYSKLANLTFIIYSSFSFDDKLL